jgi:hypothetical protein
MLATKRFVHRIPLPSPPLSSPPRGPVQSHCRHGMASGQTTACAHLAGGGTDRRVGSPSSRTGTLLGTLLVPLGGDGVR